MDDLNQNNQNDSTKDPQQSQPQPQPQPQQTYQQPQPRPQQTYQQPQQQPYQYQQQYQQPYQQPYKPPANGLAIASMVLGIVSFICYGIVTGPLAIIFGAVAKSKGNTGKMATAGLVLGIIAFALSVLYIIFWKAAFGSFLTEFRNGFEEGYKFSANIIFR